MRAIPTESTMKKVNKGRERRQMGNIELENLITDGLNKYGILVKDRHSSTVNPALLREALRPSLITQHINFQSKKIWLHNKKAKKNAIKDKIIHMQEAKRGSFTNPMITQSEDSASNSSYQSLEIEDPNYSDSEHEVTGKETN